MKKKKESQTEYVEDIKTVCKTINGEQKWPRNIGEQKYETFKFKVLSDMIYEKINWGTKLWWILKKFSHKV